MAPDSTICAARSHIFESVFAPASPVDFISGLAPTNKSPQKGSTSDKGTRSRAWRTATIYLSIPDRKFEDLLLRITPGEDDFLKLWNRDKKPSKETRDALAYLIKPSTRGSEDESKDIFAWYELELRRHFLRNFKEELSVVSSASYPDSLLRQRFPEVFQGVSSSFDRNGLLEGFLVKCLLLIRQIYFSPLVQYMLPVLDSGAQEKAFVRFQRSFHLMVRYAISGPSLSDLLTRSLTKHTLIILGISNLKERADMNDSASVDDMEVDRQYSMSYQDWRDAPSAEFQSQMMTECEDAHVTDARERLLSLLNDLQLVGLGGEKAQEAFAGVMDTMMTEFIRVAYTCHWEGPSLVSSHLRQWITDVYARLAIQVLPIINVPESGIREIGLRDVNISDMDKWQEVGIARLGALRVGELFDVIVEWPASSGAIEDLRHFTTHPAARSHLTQSFAAVLNRRLLHPGASTVEILQVYISIIRALNLLDPKGVLLDRIAKPIRKYLRDRDDTVNAIVGGLLADPADADGRGASSSETLVELAAELSKAHQTSLRNDTGELDYDDMNWMPDPVDAAPDYRKSKSSDVIGSLISIFDSKETFVRELRDMLADRLLQKRAEFEQEMSVLELLKLRFGDNALQACEVMLRDIFDSRRVDTVVRNDQGMASPQDKGAENAPELHAKILSHFFWPELKGQQFKVPREITDLQQRYSEGFESLKQSRKLTWLNGLGQVTVELDLEDRVFVEEVSTWQATVIYAFNSDTPTNGPVTKTITDLTTHLDMSAALVRSACLFWVSRRILTEVPGHRDTFSVLESLPTARTKDKDAATTTDPETARIENTTSDTTADVDVSADAAANAAAAAEAAVAKESAEAAAMEKMNLYWQFIVGMLTNQGAMPLQRIVMMLKIAVPGGFPFSNEELREFLAGMVSKGKVEIVSGGNYKIVR
ncbi:anaphase promoting complex subunit 2 [Aspergillus mulundensis]|uniref:Anaphase-promoting complex subunit 2 n=1 Tax=Aspergillus mulundensis TaxID=1810919 RepID=A0A3D8RX12_9EURO|nr:Uncharacterized protein DSM5745_05417 [Aspergillus mulundensis]RDW78565.1 Uncharacterized protein DSM5745_05417 [Aspergillus mulundensis]